MARYLTIIVIVLLSSLSFGDTVVRIQGKDVAFIEFEFYQDDRILKSGILTLDTTLKFGKIEIVFKSREELSLYEEGEIKQGVLAKNTEMTLLSNRYLFKESHSARFYRNGNLLEATLAEKATASISSTPYPFAPNSRISFYPSGIVEWGVLDRDIEVRIERNNYVFKGGSLIKFYSDGAVESGVLSKAIENIRVGNFSFSVTGEIGFYRNGSVRNAIQTNGELAQFDRFGNLLE